MYRRVIPALLFLTLACGPTETVTGASTPEASTAVVLYSGRTEELIGPLLDRFEEATGLVVEARYGSSPEMAATLLTEGENSPADLFYAQDPASIGSVAELLAALPPDVLGLVPEEYVDSDGKWVGVTARSRVLAFNPTSVSEDELPVSYKDLVDPVWRGRVGIAPTNGSFVTFVAAMILIEGEEATSAWLEGLAANEPVTFDGNAPIASAIDAGDLDVGLINHYYLLALEAEQGSITAQNHFFPEVDAGSLVMASGIGQLATASNPEGALALIQFLLSEGSQSYYAETNFEYPVVDGSPAPGGAPALSTLTTPSLRSADLAGVLDQATNLIAAAGLV